MRLWSFHPKYLDSKGLVAVWREGLLAKKVLEGKTKGYINHPQLLRFKSHPFPLLAINYYLVHILYEAKIRGYKFNENKITKLKGDIAKINVNWDQIKYEFNHLKNKLYNRSPGLYIKLIKIKQIEVHPLFKTQKGKIESWEKI